MDNKYSTKIQVLPSICDSTARLGVYSTFALFMDIATVHAEALGCGAQSMMERGLFWLTVRTKILFRRMPRLMEESRLHLARRAGKV
jgi:acyl-ACP thioesterase